MTVLIYKTTTNRGFTLVEMMVVLTVVALLASVAIPMAEIGVRRTKEESLKQSLRQIRQAIDEFKAATDQGRIGLASNLNGYPENLAQLVEGVEDKRSPTRAKIYFLRQLPRDPFADALIPAEQTWALRSYESPPNSPKAGADVYDIKSLSGEIGLNGRPYNTW
jgi:general secretion pathway protein G